MVRPGLLSPVHGDGGRAVRRPRGAQDGQPHLEPPEPAAEPEPVRRSGGSAGGAGHHPGGVPGLVVRLPPAEPPVWLPPQESERVPALPGLIRCSERNPYAMKENNYDNPAFFEQYVRFPRSVQGLSAAGEWHELERLLPGFSGKRVLDLGCGFGWHCQYASDHGAAAVIGVDLSEKMLEKARADTHDESIHYVRAAMEDVDFPPASFEVVLSSLALHYVEEGGADLRLAHPRRGLRVLLRAPGVYRRGLPGVGHRPRRRAPILAGGSLLHRGAPDGPFPGLRRDQVSPHPDHLCPGPPGRGLCPESPGGAQARPPTDGRARHGRRAAPAHDADPGRAETGI